MSGGIGLIIVWVTCPKLSELVKIAAHRWFFSKFDKNHPERINKFIIVEKYILVTSCLIAITMSLYISYNNIKISRVGGINSEYISPFPG
jgi:hypothetical protein